MFSRVILKFNTLAKAVGSVVRLNFKTSAECRMRPAKRGRPGVARCRLGIQVGIRRKLRAKICLISRLNESELLSRENF